MSTSPPPSAKGSSRRLRQRGGGLCGSEPDLRGGRTAGKAVGRAGLSARLRGRCTVCVGVEFWQLRGSGLPTPELLRGSCATLVALSTLPPALQSHGRRSRLPPGPRLRSPASPHAQSWQSIQSRPRVPGPCHPRRACAESFGHPWKNIKLPLPVAAPLLFFFFRLFFLAASSAVEAAPSSLSSGSRSPFRRLPEDAASSTAAMLPERARGSESERREPAPSSPTSTAGAGSRSARWGAGNAGTAEDWKARGARGSRRRRRRCLERGGGGPGCGWLVRGPTPASSRASGIHSRSTSCRPGVPWGARARGQAPSAGEGSLCWNRQVGWSRFLKARRGAGKRAHLYARLFL